MSDFTNTSDVMGDSSAVVALLSGTLPELSDDRIETVGAKRFTKNASIESVDLPLVTSVGNGAFMDCSNLKRVRLESCSRTEHDIFSDCVSLTDVYLPKVTGSIESMFNWCTSLERVDLRRSVRIGYKTFNACTNLKRLVLRSRTLCSYTDTTAFTNTPIANGTGYIYVPRNLLSEYANATNWSALAGQFRPLQSYTVDGTIDGELDESKI